MKIEYERGNLKCVAEGTQEQVFEQLSEFTKTFEDTKCGACGNTNIEYVVRKVDKLSFLEVHCKNSKCRARLAYGRNQDDNTIYPKRYVIETEGRNKGKVVKDENGKSIRLENYGWLIYKPENNE